MVHLTESGLIGLFVASFLAATILPLSSELVLTALLLSGFAPTSLIIVATTGNVLGSLTNYALGYWARIGVIGQWLNLSEAKFHHAEKRFKKYGLISLCFAWVPIIGDPLTVVAGALRVRLAWFLVLVTTGKLLRYVVLTYVVLQNSPIQ
jgi:membrane protein YqaA with SNARE-associated domain